MRPETVEAVRTAQRRTTVLRWTTPRDLAAVRAELHHCLADGAEIVPRRWAYPDAELGPALAAAEAALRMLSDEPPAPLLAEVTELAELTRDGIRTWATGSGFTAWSVRRFGLPDAATLAWAEGILETPKNAPSAATTVDAASMADATQQVLAAYGLPGWRVEVTPAMTARMSVNATECLIRVSSALAVDELTRDRLLLHEVGTHVLRGVNASNQPCALAPLQLLGATATEEGLASWHEREWGLADGAVLRRYAARAKAVALAQRAGVVAVARALEPLIGRSEAVDIAIRAKRGVPDPNEPGGLTKDHAYLTGTAAVTRTLAAEPAMYKLLMATKWPAELLPVAVELRQSGQLNDKVKLPEMPLLGISRRSRPAEPDLPEHSLGLRTRGEPA